MNSAWRVADWAAWGASAMMVKMSYLSGANQGVVMDLGSRSVTAVNNVGLSEAPGSRNGQHYIYSNKMSLPLYQMANPSVLAHPKMAYPMAWFMDHFGSIQTPTMFYLNQATDNMKHLSITPFMVRRCHGNCHGNLAMTGCQTIRSPSTTLSNTTLQSSASLPKVIATAPTNLSHMDASELSGKLIFIYLTGFGQIAKRSWLKPNRWQRPKDFV